MELFSDVGESDEEEVRPVECGVFTFHAGTEESLLLFVESRKPSCPSDVLSAVDEFCERRHWMMCVGPEKGEIIRRAVAGSRRICELGSYVGYSAVLLADATTSVDSKVVSFEVDPLACEWARRLVGLAGLTQRVEIRQANAANIVDEFAEEEGWMIDFLFVDHEKSRYLVDLKSSKPLLRKGTIIAADNILADDPSSREYLEYVRSSRFSSSNFHRASLEYSRGSVEDGVEITIV